MILLSFDQEGNLDCDFAEENVLMSTIDIASSHTLLGSSICPLTSARVGSAALTFVLFPSIRAELQGVRLMMETYPLEKAADAYTNDERQRTVPRRSDDVKLAHNAIRPITR